MNKIYILLPVHNRCELTRKFIESLASQTHRDFHLVVIDDGSSDGTAAMVADVCPQATIIRGDGHWWWAGCLQQGYRWLLDQNTKADDVVLLINDDTEFNPDFFRKALDVLNQGQKLLAFASCYEVGTKKKLDSGVLVDWRRLWLPQANTPEEADCFSTRGLFLKVSDFFNLGGFFPHLLPHYLSDYEFTLRARKKGYQVVTDKDLVLSSIKNEVPQINFDENSFGAFLRNYFSVKSRVNPFMWTSFVALSAPWRWKIYCLLLVWINALLNISKYFTYVKKQ